MYAFNYPLTFYSAYGYEPVMHIKTSLESKGANVIMMPNLTNPSSSIESRSQRFMKAFKEKRAHIVAHSFAGMDLRAMIHFYDLQQNVASLSTLCTPHKGLTLHYNIEKYPETKSHLVNALRPLGLNDTNYSEFSRENAKDINDIIESSENYARFSYGSRTSPSNLERILRYPANAIMEGDPLDENDGITHPQDWEWGNYMATFEADHYEIGGLSKNYNMIQIHNTIVDNIKLLEVQEDKSIAQQLGLDNIENLNL